MSETIKYANKIKEQLRFIETKKERQEMPAINRDVLKCGTKNAEMFYRCMER